MAEYRRLISYIYEYEGKTKGRNVGFVKLEARNGMCRLNVNVKKIYMGGGDMGVYLLTGRQEIFLGNIFLRNGSGEFRAMVQVADVEQSGERMDECYGLTIHEKDDDWRTYTTIWEDAVAQAAQLTLESVTSDGLVEKQVEMGKVARVAPDAPEPPESPQEDSPRRPIEEPLESPQEEPVRQPIEEPAGNPQAESAKVVPEDVLHSSQSEPEWRVSGDGKGGSQEKKPRDMTEAPAQSLTGNQLRPWHETASGDAESIFAGWRKFGGKCEKRECCGTCPRFRDGAAGNGNQESRCSFVSRWRTAGFWPKGGCGGKKGPAGQGAGSREDGIGRKSGRKIIRGRRERRNGRGKDAGARTAAGNSSVSGRTDYYWRSGSTGKA